MNKLKVISALMTVSTVANSAPVIYPSKDEVLASVIKNDQISSKVLMDNKTDHDFYVLPPEKGYAYATGLSMANTNLGFCEDMAELQGAQKFLTKRILEATNDEESNLPEVAKAQQNLESRRSELKVYTENNQAAKDIVTLNEQYADNRIRLDDLYTKLKTCVSDCGGINDEIRIIQGNQRDILNEKTKLISQNAKINSRIQSLTLSIEYAEKDLERAKSNLDAIVKRKIDLKNNLMDLYKNYAKLEGATGFFEFDSNWDKEIAKLNELNPGKSFSKVSTHHVTISASTMGADQVDSLPAILDSELAGNRNKGNKILLDAYPEQMTANVRFALTGACPVLYPDKFNNYNIEAGKPKMGVVVNYQFDSAFRTKIDCSYNEKEMFRSVLTSGSSGFLFWKKQWQNISKDNIKKTAFKCNWDSEDQAKTTFEDRRKFEIDTLNYAISRMLIKYGVPQKEVPGQVSVPSSGLSEVGKSLDRLCGSTSVFCSVAGWSLDALNLIISGGSSTGSGTTNFESNIDLQWDENFMQPVDAQTSFNTDRKI